jgi:hypothetical protein
MIYCRYYHDIMLARCEQEATLILITGCDNQHIDDRPICRDHYVSWEGYTINKQTRCGTHLPCRELIQDWEILDIKQAGSLWIHCEELIQKLYSQVTAH